MKSIFPNLVPAALAILVWSSDAIPVQAQDNEALRDRIDQLLERLRSEDEDRRINAQEALEKLGPEARPYIGELDSIDDEAIRESLTQILETWNAIEEARALEGSRVTIQGKGIRLSDAIRILQRQSGNPIVDIREEFGESTSNPAFDLDLVDVPFFPALDKISDQAGLEPYFETVDGTIGLLSASMGDEEEPTSEDRVQYSGPFRVTLRSLTLHRAFGGGLSAGNAVFELVWEPRIRPMILDLGSRSSSITDDLGKAISPQYPSEYTSVILRPETPFAEINLNFELPSRDSNTLEKLNLKAEITVPAKPTRFSFRDITQAGTELKDGPIAIQLIRSRTQGAVWRFSIILSYEGGGPAFESYQQGLFNNRIWLQTEDGSRFELNGGFNTLGSNENQVGYEYQFVDVPGQAIEYSLIYETPSKLAKIPLDVTFEDVPLP